MSRKINSKFDLNYYFLSNYNNVTLEYYNSYLFRNNPKNLIIFQNSHWDENFEFSDIFIPNSTVFESRNKLYINCLGLLKRVNYKLPQLSNIYKLNDLEIYNNLFHFFLFLYKINNFEKILLGYISIFLITI